MNMRGVKLMIYSSAIFICSVLCNYVGELRTTERIMTVVSGIIIGAFWLDEIRREAQEFSRKNQRRKHRRKSK